MSVYYPPVEQHERVITTALHAIESTHYARAENPHADAEAQHNEEQLALAARALVEAVDKLPADKQPIGWTKDREIEPEAIHQHFGLSYANYLVLPRTLLQSMPDDWQNRFVALLDELDDAFQHVPQAEGYEVSTGKWTQLDDMTDSELHTVGITVEGDDEDGPGPGTRYHRREDGAELTGQDYAFSRRPDPVPHYDRGRARVEPRLGGGE
ncbi:hypothetical protein [Streptomyces sp. NPDC018584]|uniref:hypothetical protein n=1 Tax=unclassified Streptomyces TaxID=2593676 RepID=UPI0037BB160A